MSTDGIPTGLIIFQNRKAYIAVRDWQKADGTPDTENAGIMKLSDAFSDTDEQALKILLQQRLGINSLEELTGNETVAKDNETAPAPQQPSICIFQVESEGQFFVARDMMPLMNVRDDWNGPYVVLDHYDDLIARFWEVRPGFDPDTSDMMSSDLLLSTLLAKIDKSVTITKPVLVDHDTVTGGNSADTGDSAHAGD